MQETLALQSFSDDALLGSLTALVRQSRRVESELVAHIGEVDRRRLYLREATSSMFVYCTEVLHLSEHAAYLRIAVARASREYPVLLTMLRDGRLHLSAIAKLAPHLDRLDLSGRDRLLGRAIHKSKRRVEELVAEIAAKPDVPTTIRKLPERRESATGVAGATGAVDTVEADGKSGTDARPEARLGPDRVATVQPLSPSRYIPAAVKRVVVQRDRARCTFVNDAGKRCGSCRGLEFHHDEPHGLGGDRSPENIRLLCRAHNGYLAESTYGKEVIWRFRREGEAAAGQSS